MMLLWCQPVTKYLFETWGGLHLAKYYAGHSNAPPPPKKKKMGTLFAIYNNFCVPCCVFWIPYFKIQRNVFLHPNHWSSPRLLIEVVAKFWQLGWDPDLPVDSRATWCITHTKQGPETHFIKGLWVYNWKLEKVGFALISFLIVQWEQKFNWTHNLRQGVFDVVKYQVILPIFVKITSRILGQSCLYWVTQTSVCYCEY